MANLFLFRLNIDDSCAVVGAVLELIEKYPQSLFYDENAACTILAKLVFKQR